MPMIGQNLNASLNNSANVYNMPVANIQQQKGRSPDGKLKKDDNERKELSLPNVNGPGPSPINYH